MGYSIYTKPTLATVDFGDLTGKGGLVLRVADDESEVLFRDMKTIWTNATLNALSSVINHYDFSIVTYTGSTISTINDQSTKGANITYITASAFNKSGSLQNGKYYCDCDNGTNKGLLIPYNKSLCQYNATQSFMFCFLVKFTSNSSSTTSGYNYLYEPNHGNYALYHNGTSWNFQHGPSSTTLSFTQALNTTNPTMISGGYDASTNTNFLFINGLLVNSGSAGTSGNWSTDNSSSGFGFLNGGGGMSSNTSGALTGGPSYNRFRGYIYELAILNTYSSTTLNLIEGRFAYNWGFQSSALHSGHSFYGVQPYT